MKSFWEYEEKNNEWRNKGENVISRLKEERAKVVMKRRKEKKYEIPKKNTHKKMQ